MDNFEEKILKNLKTKIAISKFEEEDYFMEKSNKNIAKSIIAAGIIVVSTAGIVFAKDIENFVVQQFNLRGIHQEQVDNGYIGTSEMDYIELDAGVQLGNDESIVDTVKTKLKITDFLITDDEFEFEAKMQFDEKINKYKDLNKRVPMGNIDYENFGSIELKDFYVLDEENNLIASTGYVNEKDEASFNKFCKDHNLDYTYKQYNEKYIQTTPMIVGAPNIIKPEENSLEEIIFNINPDLENRTFPKSKNLTIYFSKITFIPKTSNYDGTDEVHLIGNWKVELDVPEIMQNRQDVVYKVVSCDNKDFNITEAVADELGFEMGISINNVKTVEKPQELSDWEEKKFKEGNGSYNIDLSSREKLVESLGSERLADLYEQYEREKRIIKSKGNRNFYYEQDCKNSYLKNSKGEIFEPGEGWLFNFKYDVTYDENGFENAKKLDIYEGNANFTMTKFNATDKITVVIIYKNEPVTIELEKEN